MCNFFKLYCYSKYINSAEAKNNIGASISTDSFDNNNNNSHPKNVDRGYSSDSDNKETVLVWDGAASKRKSLKSMSVSVSSLIENDNKIDKDNLLSPNKSLIQKIYSYASPNWKQPESEFNLPSLGKLKRHTSDECKQNTNPTADQPRRYSWAGFY